jgi:oligoendopeptidase F
LGPFIRQFVAPAPACEGALAYRPGLDFQTPGTMKLSAIALAAALATLAAPLTHAASAPAVAPAASTSGNPPALWNLTSLYADDAAWQASREKIIARLPELKALQGTLGASAASLLHAMQTISDVNKEINRLDAYASLKADADTQVTANEALRQQSSALQTQVAQATAWEAPEIAAIGQAKIDGYIAAEPKLAPHAYALHTMLRLAAHTLSADEEALMAGAADPLSQPQAIYSLLSNADLPWPVITVRGKKVTLDQETYVKLREDGDAKVREQVFHSFWPVYKSFQRTIGAIYVAHLRGVVFDAHAHKFADSLQSRLSQDNTPDTVYRTLVAEANAGLPTLQRYLKLRGRLLGLNEQKYSDIYAELVKAPRTYTLGEAEALTLKGLEPLGEDYVKTLGQHFQEGWMDAVPRKGKRSGAYMNPGAYDVHPFVLMSFNNNYESVTTVAHEWGHAMHSVLDDAAQPYETSNYGIFVAEIPSTTNEMLLGDYVARNAKTKQEKIYALTMQLEGLRTTFFRQALFAEFELKTHDAVEKDQPLTGEDLSKIYLDLLRRYHGDAQGVMKIEDLYGSEWEYIPHFYTDYYVFQYATSISAAAYFAEGIEKGDTALRTRYLDMLRAGGSNDAYLVVKKAGLDMATPAPYRALVARMARLTDELDALTKDVPAKK